MLPELSQDLIDLVYNQAAKALQHFAAIQEFDPNQADPQPRRTALLKAGDPLYDAMFTHLYPLVAYSGWVAKSSS